MDKDINIWKQRNEILHKKVNRQMDEIKDLHKKSETIFDLARRFPDKTYRELERYRDTDRQEEAQQIPLTESQQKQAELEPIEIDWKKRAQEAEGELSIVKTTSVTNSPEMRDANQKIKDLQNSLDRFKKENNDCYTRIAEALEVNESHQRLNGTLQVRIAELEDDNKKISKQIEDKINQLRRSGL